jgi:hypothetical protein
VSYAFFVVAITLFLASVFYGVLDEINDVSWKHHGWYGLALQLIGAFLPGWWRVIILVGLWLYLDDIWQHIKQDEDPNYRSFLHLLYRRTLYKWFPRLG